MTTEQRTKTVFITGGAKRLGKAMLCALHEQGYRVLFQYLSSQKDAVQLCSDLNEHRTDSAFCIQGDLSKREDLSSIIDFARGFNGLDLLINNASQFYPLSVADSTDEHWQAIMDANLKAPYFLSQGLSDLLHTSQGNIINIVDIYGERPLKEHSIYSISKAGLIMQTKTLAVELGSAIRVNAIAPGAILWPENTASNIETNTDETAVATQSNADEILSKTTLKRKGSEADIVGAMLYLNSAEYLSGQIIQVDGGRSLYI